ncbi:MAG: PAS domain S-box protein, partial [Proteobacteria bacterium]
VWSGEWQARREGSGDYPAHADISGFEMSGRPFLIVVQRDISQEKRATDDLAFSELRFRFLAEAMPQIAWLTGAQGKGQYVNQRWLDYCGIHDRASAQIAWADFVHPDDRERSVRGWEAAAANGTPFEIQYRLRNTAGEYRWFLARSLPVRMSDAPDAPLLAWVGTATDIHEQKEAEETSRFWADVSSALYSSLDYEDRLSRIAALAMLKFGGWCVIHAKGEGGAVVPMAIAHSDSGQVIRAWESAKRLPVGEDTKVGIGWVIHHEKTQMLAEVTDEHVGLAARDAAHLELLRQGSIKSFICIPIRGKHGVIGTMSLLSSSRNFTARDCALGEELAGRAGIALENARLYGEATRAVSARDNLLSVTSHELRTPVTSLKLQLQMARRQLRAGKSDPKTLERSLDISIRQVDRLNALIEDLLNFSSVSAGKMRYHFAETDVAAIVSETLERHAESARISKTPIAQVGLSSLRAEVDPLRFGQVVENLITNALKYGAGGAVELELREAFPHFTLRVSDHGIGIPADKLNSVFERYERVGPTQGISGFGLGLYVSRAFVQAHAGTITVESTPGKGSCFTVTMPLRQAKV